MILGGQWYRKPIFAFYAVGISLTTYNALSNRNYVICLSSNSFGDLSWIVYLQLGWTSTQVSLSAHNCQDYPSAHKFMTAAHLRPQYSQSAEKISQISLKCYCLILVLQSQAIDNEHYHWVFYGLTNFKSPASLQPLEKSDVKTEEGF